MNRTTSAAIDTTFDKLAHELNSYEIRAYEARVEFEAVRTPERLRGYRAILIQLLADAQRNVERELDSTPLNGRKTAAQLRDRRKKLNRRLEQLLSRAEAEKARVEQLLSCSRGPSSRSPSPAAPRAAPQPGGGSAAATAASMLLQLGCLPFVAAPLALLGGGLPTPVGVISELALGRALLTYGAIILSFIGGLHQGAGVCEGLATAETRHGVARVCGGIGLTLAALCVLCARAEIVPSPTALCALKKTLRTAMTKLHQSQIVASACAGVRSVAPLSPGLGLGVVGAMYLFALGVELGAAELQTEAARAVLASRSRAGPMLLAAVCCWGAGIYSYSCANSQLWDRA